VWSDHPCIETDWQRHPKGYGYKYVGKSPNGNSRYVKAHVVALEEKLGRPLLPGMQSNHYCDNPPCIQPEHLYEGTQAQNIKDSLERGRRPWVRPEIREAIRARFAEGGISQLAVAREFGVSQQVVSNIVHGRKDRKAG
jgi:HNH endonuclease